MGVRKTESQIQTNFKPDNVGQAKVSIKREVCLWKDR